MRCSSPATFVCEIHTERGGRDSPEPLRARQFLGSDAQHRYPAVRAGCLDDSVNVDRVAREDQFVGAAIVTPHNLSIPMSSTTVSCVGVPRTF